MSSSPSREELLSLLDRAREALVEAQNHWGAVVHLTGDRRFQRQQAQALELIDAMHRRAASYTQIRE
jgi:hypothetical protein